MSAWAIFSMLGFYPDCPGSTTYALTTPTFRKVTLHLDTYIDLTIKHCSMLVQLLITLHQTNDISFWRNDRGAYSYASPR